MSKNETHHPSANFKKLYRRLRSKSLKVQTNKENLAIERLRECDLLILGSPRKLFAEDEFEALRTFLAEGGSISVFFSEGLSETNINDFLEDFGLSIESDAVIRTVYNKYFHPKQVLITDGVLHPEINESKIRLEDIAQQQKSNAGRSDSASTESPRQNKTLKFVYPKGVTVSIQQPSTTILSTGKTSFPINRPIAGVWNAEENNGGRMLLMGSVDIFSDDWIDQEDNALLSDILFEFLLRDGDHRIQFDRIRADEASLESKRCIPDTESLAERLKPCLLEGTPLPQDYCKIVDDRPFKYDSNLIPDVVNLHEVLNVPKGPLTLIKPEFVRPTPKLQIATFSPRMKELPPPALELFDLDENFANEYVRLAKLRSKCSDDDDAEYFVKEAGEILGIMDELSVDSKDAKFVLHHIFSKLALFKKKQE
eukprot:CAMPEP_0116021094 /NCGR_PEP_ID=MMETSP0321-20121206/10184_1 /TAXON_ID=163516 /ORGANISM="Leptocylindrus danicus var. danicus, Strain B650" /LENGTH=424 /DNA_ID=CAMNT_0003491903 /DNA_START=122 /DNA_END=1396 /DNA_ORIENTATION=+